MAFFQAIQFRGLNMISPSNSMRHRRRIDGGSCCFHDGTIASTSIGNLSTEFYCRSKFTTSNLRMFFIDRKYRQETDKKTST